MSVRLPAFRFPFHLPFSNSIERLTRLAAATPPELRAPQPLSGVRNAHRTNTAAEMLAGLSGNFAQLEGDVRVELNPPHHLELRHDVGHEPGDNLTLRQWLAIGKASGRLLKLDVKEPAAMAAIVDEVKRSGVRSDRLVFNLGDGAMEQWGQALREGFPDATLAFNPDTRRADWAEHMVQLAQRFGGKATFVVRLDLATPSTVKRLEAVAPVSVWNMPEVAGVTDPEATRLALQRLGCTGVVDIRRSLQPLAPVDAFVPAR
jgi:hypothetical protein